MIDLGTLADAIKVARYVFKDAIVAGGAVRDLALGITPKDIDIFAPVEDYGAMMTLVEKLNDTGLGFVLSMIDMEAAANSGEVTATEYAAWGRGEGELIGVAEGQFGKHDVNIVCRKAHNTSVTALINSFDVGLCQAAYLGGFEYEYTEAFVSDLLGGTVTLMRGDFPALSKKRFDRWIKRTNAEFTFVDTFSANGPGRLSGDYDVLD